MAAPNSSLVFASSTTIRETTASTTTSSASHTGFSPVALT
jgi:hypothetical protein